ncbi:putative Protein transport protein SEC23 [Blattamonas nauphoetae]|uniref:Protein transport protein SEC23 n=1 Tax=Blattamonas nauphoetae TaxID=2049346 RepID=A0ABQ9Y9K8_9EUKA|nr:putative Protein transport protein SEC23 [Blattamonas nauphoetae]
MTDQDPLRPFQIREQQSGIRTSWTCFVASNADRQALSVPLGALYTPMMSLSTEQMTTDQMPECQSCGAVFSHVDQIYANSNSYICRFCQTGNRLPPNMPPLTESNLPIQRRTQTVEYYLPRKAPLPMSMMFVIDTCLPADELDSIKDTLKQTIALLPSDFRVGIVTIGKANHLYDLSNTEIIRSYTFSSAVENSEAEIARSLGFGQEKTQLPNNRFVRPVSDVLIALTDILSDIEPDPFQPDDDHRYSRGIGSAVSLALAVLGYTSFQIPGRVMMFIGGPCTVGPGTIVGTDKKERMRQWTHLQNDSGLTYYNKAKTFYQKLADRAVMDGHCIDIFMGAVDQCGMMEMAPMFGDTGGYTVLSDAFNTNQFKLSLQNLFDRGDCKAEDLDMGFNGIVTVKASEYIQLNGMIGPCASLNKNDKSVSSIHIGKGGTNVWRVNAMDSNTTLALYWDLKIPDNQPVQNSPAIQFITRYIHANGQLVCRVTTVDFRWSNPAYQMKDVTSYFDHEAAICLIARQAVNKLEGDCTYDVLKWLDRMLIRMCKKVGTYNQNDKDSFRLDKNYVVLPQSLFYLRRSRFIQVFNFTPDETAFFRLILNRESRANMMIMIDPTLIRYKMKEAPQNVLLDISSITPDSILLLDTFFRVIVHHGETIATWREQGYHNLPEHTEFRALLEEPIAEAENILATRFPAPHVLVCDQNSSQARFLHSQLNPTGSKRSTAAAAPGTVSFGVPRTEQGQIFSDEVTLKTFLEKLALCVVQPM